MKTSGIVAITTTSLLGASFWVFLRGAIDEPYLSFRASDALVQIGVASALMALWVVWGGFITTQVARKKIHRAWLWSFLLCALALGCLCESPAGYISDLVKFGVVTR